MPARQGVIGRVAPGACTKSKSDPEGVLQVLLDEAGIAFDHADGASGGVFNLAMYCQGFTGHEIANNWRNFPVLSSICINWRQLLLLFRAESLLKYDRFRTVVLNGRWKIDWEAIKSSERCGTTRTISANTNSLSEPRATSTRISLSQESHCQAGFLRFEIGHSQQYIDAVYVTDANLMTAIDRGAEEIWIIWTVNRDGIWKYGPINTYFQIIEEASANGNLQRDLARIRTNNDMIARGSR